MILNEMVFIRKAMKHICANFIKKNSRNNHYKYKSNKILQLI